MFRLSRLTASLILALFTLSAYPADAADKKTAELVPANHGNMVYLLNREQSGEGTIVILANGKTLTPGTDYTIDFKAKTIAFLDKKLMSPGTTVKIVYYAPKPPAGTRYSRVASATRSLRWNPGAKRFDNPDMKDPRAGKFIKTIKVYVNADGTFSVNGRPFARDALTGALGNTFPGTYSEIVISGSPAAPEEAVRFVMSAAGRIKAFSVSYDPSFNRRAGGTR